MDIRAIHPIHSFDQKKASWPTERPETSQLQGDVPFVEEVSRSTFFDNRENQRLAAIAYYFLQSDLNPKKTSTEDFQFRFSTTIEPEDKALLKQEFDKLSQRFIKIDDRRVGIAISDTHKIIYPKLTSLQINMLIKSVNEVIHKTPTVPPNTSPKTPTPETPSTNKKIGGIVAKIFLVLGILALHLIKGLIFSFPVALFSACIWGTLSSSHKDSYSENNWTEKRKAAERDCAFAKIRFALISLSLPRSNKPR